MDICTEEDVSSLVHRFYAAVRTDAVLGPFFAAHVSDWDRHLPKMVDFWSSTLRRTARYRGTPMAAHAALPGLRPELFRRWLELFHATTAAQPNAALQARADDLAERIAESLWYGYQLQRQPDKAPEALTLA